MVPAQQALSRAFALAAAAGDEYERRIAAHALYYALFHCAGEALAAKTAGQPRPFYWRGRYPDGRRVLKAHAALQNGWRRYRNANEKDGGRIRRLFSDAHKIRKAADYDLDRDFTGADLNRLTVIANRLIPVIDAA